MTIVKVLKRSNPYVQIDKTGVSDSQLSWKARGLLVYLLSKPSNWEVSIKHLTKASDSDGRQSVQSGLKELEQNNYLVRFPYRDPQTGLLGGWKSYVFETPEDCLSWQQHPDENLPTNRKPVRRETSSTANPTDGKSDRREPRLTANPPLIINEEVIINDLNNLPPTPQREQREKTEPNWLTEAEEFDPPHISASDSFESGCLEIESHLGEDQLSAPPPDDVKKHEASVRKYDSALGICPPEERKTRQQQQFNWVPEGPWLIDNKLDPHFVDWQARDWLKAYGGDLHKKRADVLRHFKKDPANLAIAWEQYRSEQHHRYSNAALRMHNGMQIQPDEQQQLWVHQRAITEVLPEEISAVAVGQSGQWQGNAPQTALTAKVVAFPSRDVVASDTASASQEVRDQKSRTSVTEQVDDTPSFSSSTSSPPTNEEGNALNPDAYRVWKPQPVAGEPVNPGKFKEKLSALTRNLSMPKQEAKGLRIGTSCSVSSSPQSLDPSPSSELEELNQWLADPILRAEVMPRVMRSDRYTVEFDDCGEPIRVVNLREENFSHSS